MDYFAAALAAIQARGFTAADTAGLAAMVALDIIPERSMVDGTADMVPTFMRVGTDRGMAATDVGMAAMATVDITTAAMATVDITTAAMAAADITTAAMAAADITIAAMATTVIAIRVSAIAVGHGDPAAWFCPTNGARQDDSLSNR